MGLSLGGNAPGQRRFTDLAGTKQDDARHMTQLLFDERLQTALDQVRETP